MQVTRFTRDGRSRVGVLVDGEIADVSAAYTSLRALIGDLHAGKSPSLLDAPRFAWDDVTFDPVVDDTTTVIAVALNYPGHVKETKNKQPTTPITFFKPFTSLIGHNAPIVKPPVTNKLDYEGEIALVIGRSVYNATEREARESIWGISAMNDTSARDILRVTPDSDTLFRDWVSAKALEKSSPFGPVITPLADVAEKFDAGDIQVRTLLNGAEVQRAMSKEMLVSPVDLVRFVSSRFRLYPGDAIATGTPHGVGNATGRLLQHGDEVQIEVTGVPPLANKVVFRNDEKAAPAEKPKEAVR
jgi:2-keto-4-pentenoate hydratase/2-oxohepta-3-ene-1,7-dioic acid hydratase in catechol pathway